MDERFGLLFSFGIDNGELDCSSKAEAFVLGYELAEVFWQCQRANGFTRVVHAENQDRIRRACEHFGRKFSLKWCKNDPGEQWMDLLVMPRESK